MLHTVTIRTSILPVTSFTQTAASDGLFAYTFSNATVKVDDPTAPSTQIRIELVVYDGADKYSENHKMYFEIVPADFGDEIPLIDGPFLAVDQDCPQSPCRIQDDTITVIGTILAGNEGGEGDVTVEIAFSSEI